MLTCDGQVEQQTLQQKSKHVSCHDHASAQGVGVILMLSASRRTCSSCCCTPTTQQRNPPAALDCILRRRPSPHLCKVEHEGVAVAAADVRLEAAALQVRAWVETQWRRHSLLTPGTTSPVEQHPHSTAAQQTSAVLLWRRCWRRPWQYCSSSVVRAAAVKAGRSMTAGLMLTVGLDIVHAQPGAKFNVHVGALVLRQRPGALRTQRSE